MKLINITVAALAAGLAWNLAAEPAPAPAPAPTAAPAAADIAKERQSEIGKLITPIRKSWPTIKQDNIDLCKSALAEGEKLRQKYGDTMPAAALYRYMLVRRALYAAAERLYNAEPTAENRKTLVAYANEVIALPVHDPAMWVGVRGFSPTAEVVSAGKTLALLNIYETPGAAPKDAAKHIRDLIAMFPEKPEVPGTIEFNRQATVYALQLAAQTGEKDLTQELGVIVAKKCLATKDALNTLKSTGCPVPFEDESTLMDGRKITFPKDTQGKIVVLDFWATWCGPCVGSLPHIKEIHEKYKDRGVMVIGICCDCPTAGETPEACKKRVAEFLAKNKYDWTQVFTGTWPAAAGKYGVNSIPTVFMLDRKGNIISAQARGQEERLIEQELAKDADKPKNRE